VETTPQNTNIERELSTSYIDYAMSVIVGRALPDVRDGLKPVHRRVLYAMRQLGNTHNAAYKKSARVCGDVIGKYHPHGESAVYDTLVRMAQDFSMRYPLVDGQGNFGSRDGDAPAAMRYTEVRMRLLAEEMLADIDKDTVDFGPNYDEQDTEPLVLPARIPNLLLNGSTGIAVGMATNVPPHNLRELVDGIVAYLDNPDISVAELMTHIRGPDFPTHGIICGVSEIRQMYETGRGQLCVRGRARVDETEGGRATILVSELPYTVNKARFVESVADLVRQKAIEGISDIRDESNKDEPVRVLIELKKGEIPDVILNNLYKHTQLQMTFGAILLAIEDGRPRLMSLKDLIACFVRHRFEVLTRRTRFELAKAEARAHILEGLLKALDRLDEVVRIIRESPNRDTADERLRAALGLSEAQSRAILDMRLYQLTGLERGKIENEHRETVALIAHLRDLLAHKDKIYGLIREDLAELREAYGDDRRTELQMAASDVAIEDLIADEPCILTITHHGYIKRVPLDTYRQQRRGGKGVTGMTTREEDFVQQVFAARTHDAILFFTGCGRVYVEKVYQVPESARVARGKAMVNLLNLRDEERIASMIRMRDLGENAFFVMATERGVIKRTAASEFANVRRGGIIAINIDEGDRLIDVKVTDGRGEIMLTTEQGMSVRFREERLRDLGRATRGVRGISLRDGDRVKSLNLVDPAATFLVCTANGYGKRTAFDEYATKGRGGLGVIAIRTTERNGAVVSADTVHDGDSLVLITARGMMIRMHVGDIGVIGRATQGVRLINLDEGDSLVSATRVAEDDAVLGAEGNGAPEDVPPTEAPPTEAPPLA
jgi:DNA gyrase subunit A